MTILSIPDMSCNHCRAAVEEALAAVPGVGQVTVDLAARAATVSGPADLAPLLAALDAAGYPATPLPGGQG
jgi:copper chaperone